MSFGVSGGVSNWHAFAFIYCLPGSSPWKRQLGAVGDFVLQWHYLSDYFAFCHLSRSGLFRDTTLSFIFLLLFAVRGGGIDGIADERLLESAGLFWLSLQQKLGKRFVL